MRRMPRNSWRLAWIILSRAVIIIALLLAAHHARNEEVALRRLLLAPQQTHSHFDPWALVCVAMFLVGLAAEIRRSAISPLLNSGPLAVCLAWGLWDSIGAARAGSYESLAVILPFVIAPLATVVAIDLCFYIPGMRRARRGALP